MADNTVSRNRTVAANGNGGMHAAPAPVPAPSTELRVDSRVSVIGLEDSFQGTVSFSGDAHILGEFHGEIECAGELFVGRGAEVTASVLTNRVTVAGLVRGDITAHGRLKIASTGRVEGELRAVALVVEEGGVHHGVLRVFPEGMPTHLEPLAPIHLAAPPSPEPEPVAVPESAPPLSTGERVRKFWGELF